jgi:D-alanyl-D-alanine carboxypeptidase
VLYSKNADEQKYPASTTKILTAILALENCKLTDVATASYNAVMAVPSGYSNAAIQVGEELTIEQLLEVLLVHSANEAGYVLAEHIGGTFANFSVMMNEKAKEIGCANTNFTNPSGIHDKNHYTTAKDLALIAQYCMKNEDFRRLVSMKSCTIEPTNKYPEERVYSTTNDLLIVNNTNRSDNYYYESAIGIKTGYTSQAKNCLVSASSKDDIELICVILGATQTDAGLSARYIDTISLFDYGYDNYSISNIIDSGTIIKKVTIDNASKDNNSLEITVAKDIPALLENSLDTSTLEPEITLNENLTAPILQGDTVGTISYKINGIEYTENLVANNTVQAKNSNSIGKIILKIILIALGFIVISTILILAYGFYLKNFKRSKRSRKLKKSKKSKIRNNKNTFNPYK